MYMIVQSGGMQFRLEPHATVRVPRLSEEPGRQLSLTHVLACGDGERVLVGRPFVEGARAEVTVVSHGRGTKIRGFKFKRRKNYRRRWGHRQWYTELKVDSLVIPGLAAE